MLGTQQPTRPSCSPYCLLSFSRGTLDDYQRLVDLGVDLKGKIALSRYGGPFRGLKVKNAQQFGMLAAVLYSDPADDHGITVANGYEAYPGKCNRSRSCLHTTVCGVTE